MKKERLRKYKAIVAEKKQLEALLDEVEASIYSPRIPQLTGMPSAPSSKGGSAQERAADSTEALRAFYREKIQELHAEQLAIEKAIFGLKDATLRNLMRCKYLEGLTWEAVCVRIGYSWTRTHELHAEALLQLKRQEEPEA